MENFAGLTPITEIEHLFLSLITIFSATPSVKPIFLAFHGVIINFRRISGLSMHQNTCLSLASLFLSLISPGRGLGRACGLVSRLVGCLLHHLCQHHDCNFVLSAAGDAARLRSKRGEPFLKRFVNEFQRFRVHGVQLETSGLELKFEGSQLGRIVLSLNLKSSGLFIEFELNKKDFELMGVLKLNSDGYKLNFKEVKAVKYGVYIFLCRMNLNPVSL